MLRASVPGPEIPCQGVLQLPPHRQRPLQPLQHDTLIRPAAKDRLDDVRRRQRQPEDLADVGLLILADPIGSMAGRRTCTQALSRGRARSHSRLRRGAGMWTNVQFWHGNLPLGRAFWLWGILGGGIVSLFSTLLALALLTAEDRLDDVRRQQRQPQDPADVALADLLRLGDLGDRAVDARSSSFCQRQARASALNSTPSGCGLVGGVSSLPSGARMRFRRGAAQAASGYAPPACRPRAGSRRASLRRPSPAQAAAAARPRGWRAPPRGAAPPARRP